MVETFAGLARGAYDVILADPPWRFETRSEKNQTKGAASHYEVMDIADLYSLPVGDLAKKDCALVMWATQAQLPDALDLMGQWGFRYKSMGAWLKLSKTGDKLAFGTGFRYRSTVEPYLFGTRGNPKQDVKNVRNAIIAPAREHSRKPDEMYDQLDDMFPLGKKIELFARQRRRGWSAWGKEADKFNRQAPADWSDVI